MEREIQAKSEEWTTQTAIYCYTFWLQLIGTTSFLANKKLCVTVPFLLCSILYLRPRAISKYKPPWALIGCFQVPKLNPHFQNEAKCTTFLVKMSFICRRMKNHFHIKGWALNLVLIERRRGTWKWPIWRGNLTEDFLPYELNLGGGAGYDWIGLFSEFYGIWGNLGAKHVKRNTLAMLKPISARLSTSSPESFLFFSRHIGKWEDIGEELARSCVSLVAFSVTKKRSSLLIDRSQDLRRLLNINNAMHKRCNSCIQAREKN